VIITEFCFSTPRIIMHRWRASIITPTPLASTDGSSSIVPTTCDRSAGAPTNGVANDELSAHS